MSLEIVEAFQMAAVAAISWAHELDIIIDIVFDVLDVFVQCTLVTISFPYEKFASSSLEVFAGLLASRGGEDPSRISNNVASPEIAVDVDVSHKAFFGNMRPDNFLGETSTNLLWDVSPRSLKNAVIST